MLKAANRSRAITRQLLAFARKEAIVPEVLDLNATVESMLKMIRRLIGENIELTWQPGAGLWPVEMDPSQIDQILANLCVNARDGIADVGKIVIETEKITIDEAYCLRNPNCAPGNYVTLSVSDNGCGMNKETLDRIFEPFFTTKGLGKGTGLGLATVYGIARQNRGFINVSSEPGYGTTFKVFLPRFEGPKAAPSERINEEIPRGRNETVLVVEDESTILELTEKILERFGYKVLTAATPAQALELARAHHEEIALSLTDVIMPEMNGRELVEQLSTICPKMKYLFMSGYTADVIARSGVLQGGINFIQKPFSPKDLATKIKEVLADAKS